jgi:hypothetical protein
MTITKDGDLYQVQVIWADSAAVYNEWTFSGTFNGSGVLEYSNALKVKTVFDENGNPTVDEEGNETPHEVYNSGTGTLKMTDGGIEWTDDVEHVADGTLFVK